MSAEVLLRDEIELTLSVPRPKLYFVKVDVRAAYDTIKQDKLLQIVDALLTEVRRRPYVQTCPANVDLFTERLLGPALHSGHASAVQSRQEVQTARLS